MSNTSWKAVWEATKEPLRLLAIALIPFGLVYFGELSYGWAGALVLVLRFLDKLLHEIGKAYENEKLTTGITRF